MFENYLFIYYFLHWIWGDFSTFMLCCSSTLVFSIFLAYKIAIFCGCFTLPYHQLGRVELVSLQVQNLTKDDKRKKRKDNQNNLMQIMIYFPRNIF